MFLKIFKKKLLSFLGILISTSIIFWFLVGSTLSYRVYLLSGEFSHNAGYSLPISILISVVYAFIYTGIIFLLLKLRRLVAWICVILFTVVILFFAILNWLAGTRPDFDHNYVSYERGEGNIPLLIDKDGIEMPNTNVFENIDPKTIMTDYINSELDIKVKFPGYLVTWDIASTTRQTILGPIDFQFPKDSIQIANLFIISRIKYSEISKPNAIIDWYSCCSGARYWYEEANKKWFAEEFSVINPGDEKAKREKAQPLILSSDNGSCAIREHFGENAFYKIVSTEEGVPIDTSYYYMTDKGYAIRFSTDQDFSLELNDRKTQILKGILTSLHLIEANQLKVQCR